MMGPLAQDLTLAEFALVPGHGCCRPPGRRWRGGGPPKKDPWRCALRGRRRGKLAARASAGHSHAHMAPKILGIYFSRHIFGRQFPRRIIQFTNRRWQNLKSFYYFSLGAFELGFGFLFVLLTGLCLISTAWILSSACNATIASVGVDFSTMASIGDVPIGTTVASITACFGRSSLCRVPLGIVGSHAGSEFSEASRAVVLCFYVFCAGGATKAAKSCLIS
jgi:hypothetical protein